MYNKGSTASIKRMQTMKEGGLSSTPKRPKPDGQWVGKEKSKKRMVSKQDDDSSDDEGPDGVPLDRGIDLTSARRFRRGELVWCRIQTVEPPALAVNRGCPAITHWPALVSKIEAKQKLVEVEQKGPTWAATSSAPAPRPQTAPTAISNGNVGASNTPTTPSNVKQQVVHYFEYHLRPLGFFSSVDEVRTDAKDMLPWLVSSALMGGEEGWAALGQESVMLMEQAAKKEAEAEQRKPEGERQVLSAERWWKQTRYASRVLFVNMPEEWEFVCPRAALAIKMGLVSGCLSRSG
jgi:hypothetical protein